MCRVVKEGDQMGGGRVVELAEREYGLPTEPERSVQMGDHTFL